MKTFITLILFVFGVCVIMYWPVKTVEILLIVLFTYVITFVLRWGKEKLRSKRWHRRHKQYNRFSWYNKMGLLESASIVEPKYFHTYWRNLVNGVLK